MIKKFLMTLLIGSFAISCFAQTSEKVLARWTDGWYVGTVLERVGDRFKVVFDDGDSAIVPQSGIRLLAWSAGTRLQCNFKGSGRYYFGMITQKSGSRITVKYDDGDQEVTLIGRCRIPL